MKTLIFVSCGIVLGGRLCAAEEIVITRVEDEPVAQVAVKVAVEELRLVAMAENEGRFMLFVSLEGNLTQRVQAVGAKVGKFELVGCDFKEEYADFKSPEGVVRRVRLPEGVTKSGGAGASMLIPLLSTMKGVIGLEEAQAYAGAHGRDVAGVEKRTLFGIERQINDPKLSWDERTRLLADLISGKQQHILCPPGGIDAAFAKKYGLTPEQVASANWGETVGMKMMNGAKAGADGSKP